MWPSVFTLGVLVFAAIPVSAQTGWGPRSRIGFSIGAQLDTERLSQSVSLDEYLEPAPVTARLPKKALASFEGGLATNLYGPIGVGLALSYMSNRDDAAVGAGFPHPFYFDRLRDVSGAVGVQHTELVTHFNLVYLVASPSVEFSLSAGPSVFKIDQDLVVDVDFDEAYPYDVATFLSAGTERAQQTKVGYNVTADVTWKASRYWGLGGLVRFSRAQIAYTTVGGSNVTEMEVGGFQAAGGIRLMY
jgi:hypothetical protein